MPADTKFAEPTALGIFAFALTDIVLSSVNAGWFSSPGAAIPLGIVLGGSVQAVAGLMAYREGNTFAMTAFLGYGGFWWWFGLLQLFHINHLISVSDGIMGFSLLMWGVFSFYMWIPTFKLNWALWSIFLTVWVTFLLLALGEFGYGTTVYGGYTGLLLGLIAFYTSFAEITNWAWDRDVIPVGSAPLGDSSTSKPRPATDTT